jgi:hypothetical protein
VKFSHLSLAPMMLFDLGNKLILYICHYQTPCIFSIVTFDFPLRRLKCFDMATCR